MARAIQATPPRPGAPAAAPAALPSTQPAATSAAGTPTTTGAHRSTARPTTPVRRAVT
jgi:hypothetical protein